MDEDWLYFEVRCYHATILPTISPQSSVHKAGKRALPQRGRRTRRLRAGDPGQSTHLQYAPSIFIHRPRSQSSDTYEPIVKNTDVAGMPAYATGDLLMRHPTKPALWMVYGRVDDQIMHTNGEKVCFGFSLTIFVADGS